jgi:hypothetical protein
VANPQTFEGPPNILFNLDMTKDSRPTFCWLGSDDPGLKLICFFLEVDVGSWVPEPPRPLVDEAGRSEGREWTLGGNYGTNLPWNCTLLHPAATCSLREATDEYGRGCKIKLPRGSPLKSQFV